MSAESLRTVELLIFEARCAVADAGKVLAQHPGEHVGLAAACEVTSDTLAMMAAAASAARSARQLAGGARRFEQSLLRAVK